MLLAQIYRIQYRIEEIVEVKKSIEKEARGEYSETLENLKDSEAKKIVSLEQEINELQKHIDSLNDVANVYMGLTEGKADPIRFIVSSRSIFERLEQLIAKPIQGLI